MDVPYLWFDFNFKGAIQSWTLEPTIKTDASLLQEWATFDRTSSWPIGSVAPGVLQCNRIGCIDFRRSNRPYLSHPLLAAVSHSLCAPISWFALFFNQLFFQLYHVGYYARPPVFCLFDRLQCQIAVSWLTRICSSK
jgi:hypothetical protein